MQPSIYLETAAAVYVGGGRNCEDALMCLLSPTSNEKNNTDNNNGENNVKSESD